MLVLVIIIVLLLIAAYAINENGVYPDRLRGFWKADPHFLIDSGLVTMILYIGPGFKNREVVLYAANANGVILNNATQCDFGLYGNKRHITFGVNHPWFPAKQIMHIDFTKRCMVLTTHDGKITAKLYYDHCLSDTEDAMVKKMSMSNDKSGKSDDRSKNKSDDSDDEADEDELDDEVNDGDEDDEAVTEIG